MKAVLFSFMFLVLSTRAMAEVSGYESTDNAGLNKQERIDNIEKYLSNLSASLKKMEAKLDENAQKFKSLDDVVKAMKAEREAAAQKIAGQLGEKKTVGVKDGAELEKMKADILVLKNDEIEKLKTQFSDLNETVKALQATVRDQVTSQRK